MISKFLCSFLTNRKAKIKVGYVTGTSVSLLLGVPHGNALSLTLYTIYILDIPNPSIDCISIQYADDIT